jgi:hypothetical protein
MPDRKMNLASLISSLFLSLDGVSLRIVGCVSGWAT